MIKEKQRIEKKTTSSSNFGVEEPNASDDIQMIKTPDNNSSDLHHDLDSIIKTENEMTALIENSNGNDVTDGKSSVGPASNTSPSSSGVDQKSQLISNDLCLNQIKHEDSGIKVEDNTNNTTNSSTDTEFGVNNTGNKPSNTAGGGGNLDAQQQQYMQQQSQIFVFSTSLANKSAESVLAGQYPTIIAYHCAQPRTKKFLEKHPLKVNQFNRQNPGQWMNNVVTNQQQMKQQNKGMGPHGGQPKYGGGNAPYSRMMKNSNSPSGGSPMDGPMMQPGARMPMWNNQGNHVNESGSPQQMHSGNHNSLMSSMCGNSNSGMMSMPNHLGGGGPMGPGMMMNQQGNLCAMGPNSGGGIPMNGMDIGMMDHQSPHSHIMSGTQHGAQHSMHHRGMVGGPQHGLPSHVLPDMMVMSGGGDPNKSSTLDGMMSTGGSGPSGVLPPGSPGGPNSLAAMMPSLADFDDPIGSSGSTGAGTHPSLAGVQVPDENLTPQQRQHREEQQATLRKLQQMLFPENSNGGGASQSSSQVATSGSLDTCGGSSGAGGGMDDLMPSIDDDLDVDAVVTAAAAVATSSADLLLPPKTPTSCSSSDWQKNMFGEDDKKKDRCGPPPPPYHQTVARSASVPIVSAPSHSPNSPLTGTGVTSNLSLPSPRTCSAMNSPAGGCGRPSSNMSPTAVRSPSSGNRLQSSNPGTPIHMSPSSGGSGGIKQKGPTSNEFSPSSNNNTSNQPNCGGGQHSPDSLFGPNKKQEPNLMPVPSPQRIQYMNAFDGQELTIQKQPNTGLKDSTSSTAATTTTAVASTMSSSMSLQNSMDIIMTTDSKVPNHLHSPSSMDLPGSGRFPGTPSDFASPSPSAMDGVITKPTNVAQQQQQMRNGGGFPCAPSPPQHVMMMNDTRYSTGTSGGYGTSHQQLHKSNMMNDPKDSPLGFPTGGGRLGPGDMPLNPSTTPGSGVQPPQTMKHFDPISSLAQMNQQLANNVAGSGSSPIINHGGSSSGLPLHHPGAGVGPGHHHSVSPFNSGGGSGIHMMSGPAGVDSMCGGPMGMGSSSSMQDVMMGGPPNNTGGRMMYGGPTGGNGGMPSMGPGGGGMSSMGPGGGGMPSMGPGGGMPPSMMNSGSGGIPSPMGISGRNGSVGGMMPMNSCGGPLSPKSMMLQQQQYQQQQQRLMPRIPASGQQYNGGANIQVKPSAPNTIQYLPNNSRGGPRGAPPPSQQQPGLDFLQRFATGGPSGGSGPMSTMDGGKMPGHNLQYFPGSGGGGVGYNNSGGNGGGINDMICSGSGPPVGGMPSGPLNNIGGRPGMMRGGPAGMIRMGGLGMASNNYNPGGGGPDGMFGGGGPPPHHHAQQQMMMMGGGGGPNGPPSQQHKGGMMAGPGPPPDATQPLPPSMGGGAPGPGPGYRGGPVGTANSFIGPTTADPNYAQQFHNFQQQLYATNTRGGSGGGPGGPQQQQQFFVSK
ncbi:protein BCL9 homolog [Daktulosphaira vitifoliae]|uniref:protein BCL9 homolog n=1 Tax=Daktulosphaira vitifoliae TaxID=58002 RepID=UPI0021AACCC7|nr:protein BCL9 homolog [Daktulosphaira vitifoliae]